MKIRQDFDEELKKIRNRKKDMQSKIPVYFRFMLIPPPYFFYLVLFQNKNNLVIS